MVSVGPRSWADIEAIGKLRLGCEDAEIPNCPYGIWQHFPARLCFSVGMQAGANLYLTKKVGYIVEALFGSFGMYDMVDFGGIELTLYRKFIHQGERWTSETPSGVWLLVVVDGQLRTTDIEHGSQNWRAGNVFVFTADKPHDSRHEMLKTGILSGVFIRLAQDTVDRYLDLQDRNVISMATRAVDAPDGAARRLAQSMIAYPSDARARRLFLAGRMFELLDMLLRLSSPQASGQPKAASLLSWHEEERIRLIGQHIAANLKSPQPVVDIARKVGLSERRMNEGFKAVYGLTARGYLKSKRMALALELLKSRNLPVASVAYEVGYNPAYFSAEFHKFHGTAPSKVMVGRRA